MRYLWAFTFFTLVFGQGGFADPANDWCIPAPQEDSRNADIRALSLTQIGVNLPENIEILNFNMTETELRLKASTDFSGYVEILGQLPLSSAQMHPENQHLLGEGEHWWQLDQDKDTLVSNSQLKNGHPLILGFTLKNDPETSCKSIVLFFLVTIGKDSP